ncbi:class I SAM-dependent methyltransferase [Candidatus Nitrosocosmicus arcticus]|uniref:Thiopurine S-methyltransferase (TPMT) n=1 Tax=Candidatus Nitrosocosmicus arcticus TaxID=2035267 RepID=A0A557STU9_9ARCH|nr:class I SAM-dependent methyltransferase [Candidatus Nitrosocosmicus arcticus]TVP40020.1 Thiopurine S-methyltransferase (TPMT) [Candidatus Nitrosocosmicus arcticus]
MTENTRAFPDWETLYKNQEVESMPWYNESLDPDLKLELDKLKIKKGYFLDLGTGPGTQAIRLFERGFDVTASDLSPTSIHKASVRYNKNMNNKIKFIVDDIINSHLNSNEFDFIFDRGCFHVISPEKRSKYTGEVNRILKEGGLLFLKCFSKEEPSRDTGPYRFSHDMIKKTFENIGFKIQSIRETVYQGTLNPLPKALFVVISK